MPIIMLMMVSSVIGISQNIPGQQLTKQMYHQKNGEISPYPTTPKKQMPFFVQTHNRSLTPSTIILTTSAILYLARHLNFPNAFDGLARPSVKSVGRYN